MASCTLQPSLTDGELDAVYGTGKSLLSGISGAVSRDSNGMLTSASLNTVLAKLKTTGVVSASGSPALKDVKEEYCFYYARYMNALEKLFAAVSAAYSNPTSALQGSVNLYLAKTQTLNAKLNDLTQIINAVTEASMASATNLSADVQAYNAKVQELQKKLQDQNAILNSSEATMQLNKQMVKYTEEKARRSDNLMQLYGFLNVVALGLLVYVYRLNA